MRVLGVLIALVLTVVGMCFFGLPDVARAASAEKRVALPKPATTGGKPLMEALAVRSANREFANKPLDDQTLSNLLWATWGVNRPDGRRTAPSAMNKQDIHVYAALESGVWLYDAVANELVLAMEGDTRATFGGAPLTLLFAVPESSPAGGMHAGSLYQNAGLFCASAGLANVVKTTGARELDGKLSLPGDYQIIVVQSVGYPR